MHLTRFFGTKQKISAKFINRASSACIRLTLDCINDKRPANVSQPIPCWKFDGNAVRTESPARKRSKWPSSFHWDSVVVYEKGQRFGLTNMAFHLCNFWVVCVCESIRTNWIRDCTSKPQKMFTEQNIQTKWVCMTHPYRGQRKFTGVMRCAEKTTTTAKSSRTLTGIMSPVHSKIFVSSTWISRNARNPDVFRSLNSCRNENGKS